MPEEKKQKGKSGGGFAIFIALVAIVISIAAILRTSNQGQLQWKMGEVKEKVGKDLSTTRDYWNQRMAELSTQIELLEAKSNLLKARMYVKLNNDFEKAAAEIQEVKTKLAKAKNTAAGNFIEAIGSLETQLEAMASDLKEKSPGALAKLEEFWQRLSSVVNIPGKKE